jgi:hypothetical protein
MAETLGPTNAATSHVRQGRAAARAAQVRWRASRPQHHQVAGDLPVVWHAGCPWVPSDDPATTLGELRLLLGGRDAVTMTVCAELPLAVQALAVMVVRVVDVLDHSTGPQDVPWLRAIDGGVLFGIMLHDVAWIRSGYWGARTGLPGDAAVDDVAAAATSAGADPLPMRGQALAHYLEETNDLGQLLHTSLRFHGLSRSAAQAWLSQVRVARRHVTPPHRIRYSRRGGTGSLLIWLDGRTDAEMAWQLRTAVEAEAAYRRELYSRPGAPDRDADPRPPSSLAELT